MPPLTLFFQPPLLRAPPPAAPAAPPRRTGFLGWRNRRLIALLALLGGGSLRRTTTTTTTAAFSAVRVRPEHRAVIVIHHRHHQSSWWSKAPTPSSSWSHRSSTSVACRAAPLPDGGDLGDDDPDSDGHDDDPPPRNAPQFYDDFDGRVIGGSLGLGGLTGSSKGGTRGVDPSELLLGERIRGVTLQEDASRQQTQNNWKRGHWEVRGFRLDPDPPIESLGEIRGDGGTSEEPTSRVHVCLVAPDPDDPARLWVGRTDGSLLAVQMGTDYLTSFQSKLSATYAANTGAATIAPTLVNVQDIAALASAEGDDDDEGNEDGGSTRRGSPLTTPFELEFQCFVPGGCPLSKLLVVGRPEDASSHLLVTTKESGDIVHYRIEEGGDRLELQPLPTLQGGHGTGSNVVLLQRIKSVVVTQGGLQSTRKTAITTNNLVSVADDGTVAVWDLASSDGPLKYHCQLRIDPDSDGDAAREPVSVCSADCDNQFLFVGTRDGRILVYELQTLLRAAEATPSDPIPMTTCGQWVASPQHQQSITALKCAGPGSLGQQQEGRAPTITLMTGDRSGTIKQWEVFSRTSEPDEHGASTTRVDHWPKLATQRLPKRAHAFRSMHIAAVTAILPLDDGTIVSASHDGSIVAWDPATGQPHFFMDGFEPAIRSLCWQDNTLVTDGMKHLVCVHDFGIEPPEEEDEDSWDFDFGAAA